MHKFVRIHSHAVLMLTIIFELEEHRPQVNSDAKTCKYPSKSSRRMQCRTDMRNGLHDKVSQAHGFNNPKEDSMKNKKLRNALNTLSFLDTEIETDILQSINQPQINGQGCATIQNADSHRH